jgi:hypothetical protein
MSRRMSADAVEREVGMLSNLPRPDLLERWRSLYRSDAPKGMSRTMLVHAVAWAMQARAHGGLRPSLRRRLRALSDAKEKTAKPQRIARQSLAPGSRLVREWNGSTHVVEVTDGGFVWNGQPHRSLSAIARAITGARWSGPRFFGLGSGDRK